MRAIDRALASRKPREPLPSEELKILLAILRPDFPWAQMLERIIGRVEALEREIAIKVSD